jgi:hypothetical protein
MSDIKSAGFCLLGLRKFCLDFGINIKDLATSGIPVEDVANIQDANLSIVLGVVESRENQNDI